MFARVIYCHLIVYLTFSGELVEKGIMRRLPEGFDGMQCPYIFTWSDDIPNKTWAMGSGTSAFYNTDAEGKANTTMTRHFDTDTFEIYASRKCL